MEGQVTAVVYKTIVRYTAIEGSSSPPFRFFFFVYYITNN